MLISLKNGVSYCRDWHTTQPAAGVLWYINSSTKQTPELSYTYRQQLVMQPDYYSHGTVSPACPVCVSLPNAFKQNAYSLVCLTAFCMYRQFNIQHFSILPTQLYLCVLCGSQNKQRLFPYRTLPECFL